MNINLFVITAKKLRDVQIIGKQDPYCRVVVGNNVFKTHTSVDSGSKARIYL